MRCPQCEFIFSDDFDLCPGCRSDVREFKRRLGLTVHYADISHEALKAKLEQQRKPVADPRPPAGDNKKKVEPQPVEQPVQAATRTSDSHARVVADRPGPDDPHLQFDRGSLMASLRNRRYSPAGEALFNSVRSEGAAALSSQPQNVSVAHKLPDLAEIDWRFDEVRREAQGTKHDTYSSTKRIQTPKSLLDKMEAASLNPSLTQHREAIETYVVPPTAKEVLIGNLLHVATICVTSMLLVLLMHAIPFTLPKNTELLFLARDFCFIAFGVSWFMAFWPLLNNGKLIGGIYLVEQDGIKASLTKLFYRGIIFPPLYFLFLWPIGMFSGNALHTRLVGLQVSTVTF